MKDFFIFEVNKITTDVITNVFVCPARRRCARKAQAFSHF